MHEHEKKKENYAPLVVVLLIVLGLAFSTQYFREGGFELMNSMRYFMAYFFLLFGSFKLLDLKKFVDMYAEYDVVTKRFRPYGFLYPFIELTLGVLYLLNLWAIPTNIATVVVMSVSSVGVIQAVTNKKRIRCACLGAVIKLPMSTITIIEDIGMGLMALVMLILLIVG